MTINTPENIDQIAKEFINELKEWLRRDHRTAMNNKKITPKFVREANDYYDANMAMGAAFKHCGFDPFDSDGGMNGDATDLWNAAWDRAVKMAGEKV